MAKAKTKKAFPAFLRCGQDFPGHQPCSRPLSSFPSHPHPPLPRLTSTLLGPMAGLPPLHAPPQPSLSLLLRCQILFWQQRLKSGPRHSSTGLQILTTYSTGASSNTSSRKPPMTTLRGTLAVLSPVQLFVTP